MIDETDIYENEQIEKPSVQVIEAPSRSHVKLMLAGGVLGIIGAAFMFAAPELGFASAFGGLLAGVGSASMTLIARR